MQLGSAASSGPATAAGKRRHDARGGRVLASGGAINSVEHRDQHLHHRENGTSGHDPPELAKKIIGQACIWLRRSFIVLISWRLTRLRGIPFTFGTASCLAVVLLLTLATSRLRQATTSDHAARVRSKFLSGRGIADLRSLGYESKPRTMGCYFLGVEGESILRNEPRRLYTYYERYPSKRLMHVSDRAMEAQKRLQKSRNYRRGRAEPFETQDCRAQYEWQLALRSTCNEVHQTDMNDLCAKSESEEKARIVASGFWRDTWLVRDSDHRDRVLKTMRYVHDFVERNYDRHRRDALASERLSSSDSVVDIFSFCGNSGVYEFVPGGDINDAIWPLENDGSNGTDIVALTKMERLDIALQVATAISDMHTIDMENRPSIAHTDITPGQFLQSSGGKYKLTDFNRARFLRKNVTAGGGEPCTYIVGRNPGKFRSPEEYSHREQTEKVDVYSMGNVFYSLLTEYWPFEGMDEKEAQQRVVGGERPPINDDIRNSGDPVDAAFVEAINMCWRHNPTERATAKEVKSFLNEQIKSINGGKK